MDVVSSRRRHVDQRATVELLLLLLLLLLVAGVHLATTLIVTTSYTTVTSRRGDLITTSRHQDRRRITMTTWRTNDSQLRFPAFPGWAVKSANDAAALLFSVCENMVQTHAWFCVRVPHRDVLTQPQSRCQRVGMNLWRFGVVVARWSHSTCCYVGPG